MSAKAKKWLMGLAGVLVGYLAIGHLLHRVVFPMPAPDPATYPRVGDRFGSAAEGVEHHVSAIEDGYVHGELVVLPGAAGPPLHFHETFDETFTVTEGTLHLQVGDDVIELGPGESYRIPIGVPHKPFNPTDERVVIGGDRSSIPQTFAACLVQLYAILDAYGGTEPGPGMMLQMSVIDPICDTHLAEVPTPVLKVAFAFAAPIARLAGYRNYDPMRSLHPPTEAKTAELH